jgi:hypothetical protein
MAYLESFCEVWNRTYTHDISGKKTATRVFLVQFDSSVELLSEVLELAQADSSFPQFGDEYDTTSLNSFTLGLVARKFTPKEYAEQQNLVFLIEIEYENNEINFGAPTLRPWTVTWSSIKEDYVPFETLFNTGTVFPLSGVSTTLPVGINEPVLNSAGDFFDPPVIAQRNLTSITLQKNFEAVTDIGAITDITDLMSRVGTVNDDIVTIGGIDFDYFQGKIEDISMVYTRENGENFYNFTITIIFNPQYHVLKLLNAGYNKDVNGKLIKIVSGDGSDLAMPSLLDEYGAPIIATDPADRRSKALYYVYGVNELSSFDDLDLPMNETEWNDPL